MLKMALNEDLQFRITITPVLEDGKKSFLVEYPDLPGCMAQGTSLSEALLKARAIQEEWMDAARRLNKTWKEAQKVATSQNESRDDFVSSFVLRLPRHLYVKLARIARARSQSIDHTALVMLNEKIRESDQ